MEPPEAARRRRHKSFLIPRQSGRGQLRVGARRDAAGTVGDGETAGGGYAHQRTAPKPPEAARSVAAPSQY
ncbi:MAG: hypothetical protein LBD24_02545 [Spirochaetaceae bacterium]|nr:hypothetical protein [Spirochaetaceae bacterium]